MAEESHTALAPWAPGWAGIRSLLESITRWTEPLARVLVQPIRNRRLSAASLNGRTGREDELLGVHQARAALLRQERMATMGRLSASIAHEVNNPISFMLSNLHQATKEVHEMKEVIQRLLVFADQTSRMPESNDPRLEQIRERAECAIGGGSIDSILSEVRDLEEIIAESMEGAERIRRVSDDMRRFAHGLPGILDWADVSAIVQTALQVVGSGSPDHVRLIRCSESLEPMPEVLCQRHQIAQVLLNLLQNAIEALDGAGTVQVRTRFTQGWVEIEVADDGPGLPAQSRAQIFDAFYTTKEEGTGLGLAISRDIAKSHGGSLEAVAAETGACFRLRLPIETT
jgi:signal transduction histidine kinase